jgi:hypothetical protein
VCVYIDLGLLEPAPRPAVTELADRNFDGQIASGRGGGQGSRDPRLPYRKLAAAVASVRDLPMYTRNTKDFKGLESLLEV